MGAVRKEDQRCKELDRKNQDSSRFSTEQEETVEGPAWFARKNACGHSHTKDQNLFIC